MEQVERVEGEAMLPQTYDPDTISAYWGKRPGSVLTRVAQLLSVAGGFLSHVGWDIINKKFKEVGILSVSVSSKNLEIIKQVPIIVGTTWSVSFNKCVLDRMRCSVQLSCVKL